MRAKRRTKICAVCGKGMQSQETHERNVCPVNVSWNRVNAFTAEMDARGWAQMGYYSQVILTSEAPRERGPISAAAPEVENEFGEWHVEPGTSDGWWAPKWAVAVAQTKELSAGLRRALLNSLSRRPDPDLEMKMQAWNAAARLGGVEERSAMVLQYAEERLGEDENQVGRSD